MYLQTKLHTTFAEEMNGLYVECVARRCGVYARLTELVSALSDHLLSANSLRLPVLLPLINGQCPGKHQLGRRHGCMRAPSVPSDSSDSTSKGKLHSFKNFHAHSDALSLP